jgi:ABC-2 type transport system ATP-binding protein
MIVLDQLVFLGRLHYLPAALAEQRVRAWCEKLQIAEALPKKTEDLSKGMQQKIQFISTLLHDPDLIIMDEPFSGLDPVNANLLMDTLLELRSQGKAVVFSTHRMDQVEKLCDQIALIHRGRLVLSGSMTEIKASYPHNRIHIVFDGDDSFLRHPSVEDVRRFPGQAEIRLRPSPTLADDAQSLLALALQHAQVTRFAVTEPTLEEIFIEKVRETSSEPIDLSTERLQESVGSYQDA